MAYSSPEVRHCWGFAHPVPTLQQLRQSAAHQSSHRHSPDPYDAEHEPSYLSSLESSHAFSSNACVDAMAAAFGLSTVINSFAGSLLSAHPGQAVQEPSKLNVASPTTTAVVAATAADSAKEAVWKQIDAAWAAEAVKRGVAHAKTGEYQQAMGCYDKALELNPNDCDALVARGAALANQGHLSAAVADFEAALRRQPDNANAAKYLQATQRHMQAAGADGREQQQQQQQQVQGHAKLPQEARQQQQQQQQRRGGWHGSPSSSSPNGNRGRRHGEFAAHQGRRHGELAAPHERRRSRSRSRKRGRGTSKSRSKSRDARTDRGRLSLEQDRRIRSSSRPEGQAAQRTRSRSRSHSRHRRLAAGIDRPGDGAEYNTGSKGQQKMRQVSRSVSRSRSRSRTRGRQRSSRKRSRHRHSDSASSSSTGDGSSSAGGSSSSSSSDSEPAAAGAALTVSDIRAAINTVRSAQKVKGHKRGKEGSSSRKKSKHGRLSKGHGSSSKHKHKKSKRHK